MVGPFLHSCLAPHRCCARQVPWVLDIYLQVCGLSTSVWSIYKCWGNSGRGENPAEPRSCCTLTWSCLRACGIGAQLLMLAAAVEMGVVAGITAHRIANSDAGWFQGIMQVLLPRAVYLFLTAVVYQARGISSLATTTRSPCHCAQSYLSYTDSTLI